MNRSPWGRALHGLIFACHMARAAHHAPSPQLPKFDSLWEVMWPAKRAQLIRLWVERIACDGDRDVRVVLGSGGNNRTD